MRRILQLELTSEDVGGTQHVTVSLGNYELIRLQPGTRYYEYALSEVEAALVVIFRGLIEAETGDDGVLTERNIYVVEEEVI